MPVLRRKRSGAFGLAVSLSCLGTVALSVCSYGAPAYGASPARASSRTSLGVSWMPGYRAPGTPAQYNVVGVIKVGPSKAKNVLVMEPGTSAAAAYFVPLAQWIVANEKGWQVWAVQRRENLLEDQSELNLYKEHDVTTTQLFDYYLGYIKNSSITDHFQPIANSSVEYASQWGMNVAVQDLHRVIVAAKRLGGKVVLGGHSLGGSIVTAYATWDFHGRPGADGLSGLVYIDGGSSPTPVTSSAATGELDALEAPGADPWLSFGGIAAPYAGLFVATGAASALYDPDAQSLGESSGLLPSYLVPSVPVSNVALFGYALNVGTSPAALAAAQAHLGTGIRSHGAVRGWNGTGALTPISRFAEMFAGANIENADGSEWYFPQRLTDDTGAVGNGIANPAQSILDVNSTMGDDLPKGLKIYAFCTSLGGTGVLTAAQTLATQSGIAASHLTLVNASGTPSSDPAVVNEPDTYAHNDPAGAYPNNFFFNNLETFLGSVSS